MRVHPTRREALACTAAAAAQALSSQARQQPAPWHRRTYRWGQTNITERDPVRYDVAFWRAHWRRTGVQGVIINAGGIVAYYPSKYPLHARARFLGDRDLYGDLARAAHEDGLAVLARMDSNRAGDEFFRAHPDWFTRDATGEPYRAGDKFIACIHGPYYEEYLPGILTEIIERSRPEGVTDNSWSGLGRQSICYCENCARKFRAASGYALPKAREWNERAYREWIRWNYAQRLEIWDLNNKTTKSAGGQDCLWIGMNSGSISNQCRQFRDFREICRRAGIIMLDHQARDDDTGFQQNAETGKRIHGLLGWDKLIPESMAMYQAGTPTFRLTAKPVAEARLWMLEGFAGGLQPWWHHVGAYHEDRRAYRTAEPVMRWHGANQQYLVNRQPVAAVGVVWSQRNSDFHGRDDAETMVEEPYYGIMQALVRARIPYVPVHADDIGSEAARLAALILPNLAAVSGRQCAAIRGFVERGGALLATGASTLYDEWGDVRPDFALADVFGTHAAGGAPERPWAAGSFHSYLRFSPGGRHPALSGFDETDILPFGGMLTQLTTDPGALVALTFIPPFPIYPPETAWMREDRTSIPALVLRTTASGARIAFLPADIDRRYHRGHLPDHGNLLAGIVRWLTEGRNPLSVEGPGLIDCHLYRQPLRLILHLVNLTSAGTWRAPVEELIPLGPFRVRLDLPDDVRGLSVELRVAAAKIPARAGQGRVAFEVPSIRDHEMVVIE